MSYFSGFFNFYNCTFVISDLIEDPGAVSIDAGFPPEFTPPQRDENDIVLQ